MSRRSNRVRGLGVIVVAAACVTASVLGCAQSGNEGGGGKKSGAPKAKAGVTQASFGSTKEGQDVQLFTLTNKNGLVAKITNYGGIITETHVPDRNGQLGDVTLGFTDLAQYQKESPFFGALVGRYGN